MKNLLIINGQNGLFFSPDDLLILRILLQNNLFLSYRAFLTWSSQTTGFGNTMKNCEIVSSHPVLYEGLV